MKLTIHKHLNYKKKTGSKTIKAIAVLVFISFTILCHAQGFLVGAEAGAGGAWLRGGATMKSRFGYSGGLFAQYDFKKIISLRTGAYYDMKGAAYDLNLMDVTGIQVATVRAWNDLNYLTVPLLLRATFGRKIQYFINAGPYASFLMKQRDHYPDQSYNNIGWYNSTDVGVSLGIGMSYTLERFVFSGEARSSTGLTNISALTVFNRGTLNTNAINLMFGMACKLGKNKSVPTVPANK